MTETKLAQRKIPTETRQVLEATFYTGKDNFGFGPHLLGVLEPRPRCNSPLYIPLLGNASLGQPKLHLNTFIHCFSLRFISVIHTLWPWN